MLSINCQLFHNSPLLHVEIYPFVGLLDANGNTLEINRAALDGAEIQLRPVLSVTTIGPIAAHSVLKLYA
jgi:hypothetical protein